jgi:putative tryptophan/tyrosine transport system substrate-binding protein
MKNKRIRILIVAAIVLVAIVGLYLLSTSISTKKKIVVVTWVTHPVLNKIENSFKSQLKELCGVDTNYVIITFNAQNKKDNLVYISRQIKNIKPYLIVTISTPVTQYIMKDIDKDQKIVYTFVTNPSDLGDELTRTNSTGLSDAINYAANIDLISKLLGENIKLGIIYNPNEANSVFGIERVKSIISDSRIQLVPKTVNSESDIPFATSELLNSVDCIYIIGDNTVVGSAKVVINEAINCKKPVFASDEGSIIDNGALCGISVDYSKLGRETAKVVKQIIDGKQPKEIARIQLPGDELIINLLTANLINFSFPDTVLSQANIVIKK